MKKNICFVILCILLVSMVGCSQSMKESEPMKSETQTAEPVDTNTIAKERGYKSITEFEYDGRMLRSANIQIDDEALLNAIKSVMETTESSFVSYDLDDEYNKIGNPSLSIEIQSDDETTFLRLAESLFTQDEIRKFETITLLMSFNKTITIKWDEANKRFQSYCNDLSAEKKLETAYQENELFIKMDFKALLENDLDDLKKEYGLVQ